MTDPLANAISRLTSVLETLGVRYAVVGSLASSAHGVFRATADGDLLASLRPELAAELVAGLGSEWYTDEETIERAIREKRSFNVIHMTSAQKIDIFPATSDFHAKQLDRATTIPVFASDSGMRLPVASPEDVLLAKLQWYRMGGEVSDRQWGDIVGLLAANAFLDLGYVRQWAPRLHVEDLLSKALGEAERDQA